MSQMSPNENLGAGRLGTDGRGGGADQEGALKIPARLGLYLRRLREGYGYTLRKVEERATALGESIDNSQLSRFEKGKAVPSFEKLRALARIFNVPVQNFSDVLDLAEYEAYKPESADYDELLKEGKGWFARGEYGRSFVTYERALEVAEQVSSAVNGEGTAEARWRMACALKSLGKLSMAERELRDILKLRRHLKPRTRMNALLQLSYLYRELSDLYLATVMANECLEIAVTEEDLRVQAGVLNTLGNILHDEGQPEEALAKYHEAMTLLDRTKDCQELRATLMTNLGGCMVAAHRMDEGIRQLRQAHLHAKEMGFRRVAALSLTRLGEAYIQAGDNEQAKASFAESDCLASRPSDCYHDILFLNAFRRWELARLEHNGTREKIAFGRLRHLRSLIQRRFAEVDEFDRYIEGTRRRYDH